MYSMNPQFQFDVPHNDPNDDHAMVVISLLLCDFRKSKWNLTRRIGFRVYKIKQGQNDRINAAELTSLSTVRVVDCKLQATRTTFLQLTKGSYLIVPGTMQPNQRGEFRIRMISQFDAKLWELNKPNKRQKVSLDNQLNTFKTKAGEGDRKKVLKKFGKFCDKETRTIDAIQLQKLFKDNRPEGLTEFRGFEMETCRLMIIFFSHDHESCLNVAEFLELWIFVYLLSNVFIRHCPEQKGHIQTKELRKAFESAGYIMSNNVFSALLQRHLCPTEEDMNFNDFITCVLRMKNIHENAAEQPQLLDEASTSELDDFIVRCIRT